MDHERFREWFSHVDELTTAQCKEVAAVLSDPPEGAASLAAIELGVDDERRYPHCASAGAVSRGKARGLRRYRCKACGKTFGALTGTALSGLHHKERWLAFGASLGAGETIREAAERCGIAPSTAHRWRPPLPGGGAPSAGPACRDRRGGRDLRSREPEGGAEAGSQAAPARRQGPQTRPLARAGADPGRRRSRRRDPQPHLARPQRKEREGGAGAGRRPRCLARLRRQPLLSARRSGAGHPSREHQRRRRRAGSRRPAHPAVNSRHSQIKGFLRGFRSIATKYLDSYLRWFHLIELGDQPSPRACLEAAMARPCLRFAN